MIHALRLLALALLLMATSAGAAEIKPFARDDMASDAVRLTETLRIATAAIGAQVKDKAPDQLRKEAAAASAASNFDAAEKLAGAAITAVPKDPANWLAYAGVAIKADGAKANGRYQLVTRGATAAYAAYLRSTTPDAQAGALAMLADLLARHELWRPALDALKASLDRRDAIDVRKTYEAMRAEHGFRILDYKVDNESTSPRVCFNFSEELARKTDFSPYVAVSGSSNTAISNEDQQICVEGLKHGERYAIVLRQGLPSAVGEQLLKSADYEIYVRDRSPQAHFAGRAYVLPRQGQQGAPLVTVNTAKVSIDVYRVGDRNLLATVNRDDFLKPIDSSRAEEIASQDGAKIWSGTMDVASALNEDVVTDFPVLDAVGKLEPGVYVIAARPWKGSAKPADSDFGESVQLAAQWMVVSDLGLTAVSGEDGVHAIVQSLGSAAPLAGVELRLIARNNEVLATKATDAQGRVDFDPGLSRGKGGIGAWPSHCDVGRRLRLSQPRSERLRPHRSRRRRPRRAEGARRVSLYRARRLPLRRNRLRHGAVARLQGRGENRLAADAGRQAAGRGRIQARGARRRGTRRALVRDTAAARLGGGEMVDRGLRRSEGRQYRPGRVPARGLHSRAPRFHPAPGETDHRSRRADPAFARREVPLSARRRAGST